MSKRKLILSKKQMQQLTEGGYLNNCEGDFHNAYGNETFSDGPLSDVASGDEYAKPVYTDKIAHTMTTNFTRNNYAGITSMPVHESMTKKEFENSVLVNEEYDELSKKKIKASPTMADELDGSTRVDSTASKLKNGNSVSFEAIKNKVKRIRNGQSKNDSEESNDAIEKEYERQKEINRNSKKAKAPIIKQQNNTKLNPIVFNLSGGGIKGKNDTGIITIK